MDARLAAGAVIAALDLRPHPEGGHFREIHRDPAPPGGRSSVTSIYFLLAAGERSHWHRVDATEIWNFHAGAPLELAIAAADGQVTRHLLSADIAAGERPQGIVPPGCWQAARTLGDWTLVGCQVAPGFDFAGFELAPPGWAPDTKKPFVEGDRP